jgi:membrane dipeptidase
VGPDHVGLGSDFDGIGTPPKGLEDVSKMPNVTRVLVKREYSDGDILKILGGNHLRVFKEVLK